MDIVCVSKANPKVCASVGGLVVVAKSGLTGYGNYVVLEHIGDDGSTFYTLYGHLTNGSIQVTVGETVEQGRVLGIMGSTGNSTGPHLHFEIRINGEAVDPLPYLAGEK